MEPAELLDELLSRAEVQVVRVREDDVGTERAHLVRVQALHGALRADRHEGGSLAVRSSRRATVVDAKLDRPRARPGHRASTR